MTAKQTTAGSLVDALASRSFGAGPEWVVSPYCGLPLNQYATGNVLLNMALTTLNEKIVELRRKKLGSNLGAITPNGRTMGKTTQSQPKRDDDLALLPPVRGSEGRF